MDVDGHCSPQPCQLKALCPQAGDEAWQRQGNIQHISSATDLCSLCEADPLPRALSSLCPGKVPVCGDLVSQWVKAVETRSLPSCQVYPGLICPKCSPAVGLEEAFVCLSPALCDLVLSSAQCSACLASL